MNVAGIHWRHGVDSLLAIVSVEAESWTPSIPFRSRLHVGVDSCIVSLDTDVLDRKLAHGVLRTSRASL